MHFEFVSVELFKVEKYPKSKQFLKLTAKPKVLENLKRSWKKSCKVMEFGELMGSSTNRFHSFIHSFICLGYP